MNANGGYAVEPTMMVDYANYMEGLADDALRVIRQLAVADGMESSGFTGLMAPLEGVVDRIAIDAVGPAVNKLYHKLYRTGEAVRDSAFTYGLTEQDNVRTVSEVDTEFPVIEGVVGHAS